MFNFYLHLQIVLNVWTIKSDLCSGSGLSPGDSRRKRSEVQKPHRKKKSSLKYEYNSDCPRDGRIRMDSTVTVAPLTPALKRRIKLVSGLTGQTCKLASDLLIFDFQFSFLCLDVRFDFWSRKSPTLSIFIYLIQRWLLLPQWDGLSSW